MALPPSGTTDEAFLREVDEEYRRDQLANIWRNYGRWIIVAVVAALVGLAGYIYWGHHTRTTAGAQGEKFDAALRLAEENQIDKAVPEFDKLAKGGAEGYSAIARLTLANALLSKNDVKGAAAKYGEISADSSLPKPFRDLAALRQTLVEYDQLKPEVVIDRLKGMAVPASPWFGTAGEMVAAAYIKQGKRAEAGKLLGQIAQGGDNVPETIRQRTVQLAGVLGVDAIDQSKEAQAK
ncbi:MAG: tetratricopeptide repeat protein [Sphingomonadales bacterium]|nr:MAG: tetratricopeptide repeat protein [Sphingomonadales bacterium]